MPDLKHLTTPDKIAEAGEQLYADRFKADLEAKSPGQFVAIDVLSERAFVAQFPEEALKKARDAAPNGILHLIRIGSPGAFKVSYSSRNAGWDRIFR